MELVAERSRASNLESELEQLNAQLSASSERCESLAVEVDTLKAAVEQQKSDAEGVCVCVSVCLSLSIGMISKSY